MRLNDESSFESVPTSRAASRSDSRGTRHEAVHAVCPRSSLTANQAGNTNYNAASTLTTNITINKITQTIVGFNPASPQVLAAGGTFTLAATGGASGLPVMFASTTLATCTTSGTNGATVTVVTHGICTLTANQAGNANYNAATPVIANVTLIAPVPEVYFIHPDHLGTPRTITRAADNAKVWEWENAEAFGNNPPNENPAGNGVFAYNLRFPGQVFDKETGTSYNYFRDYDSSLGRYVQSDPIGLKGGINTFGYVSAEPMLNFDPKGLYTVNLKCESCTEKRLENIKNEISSMCNNVNKRVGNVALRNCLKQRCDSGRVTIRCDKCPVRGYYNCDAGGEVNLCINKPAGPEGYGGTVLHEWAHSCNWTHGDGMGVPHDHGSDGTPRCSPTKPIGTPL